MTMFSAAISVQALVPAAETFAATAVTAARPALGLGAVAMLLLVFRPLVIGLMRAALLLVNPRKSIEERNALRSLKAVWMINRMAKEFDATQPNQAAELRWLASRG